MHSGLPYLVLKKNTVKQPSPGTLHKLYHMLVSIITLILLNYCFPLNCVQFIIMILFIHYVGQRKDIVKGAVMCTLLPSASGSNTDSSESRKRVRGTEND